MDHVEADVPGRLRLMWDTEELIRQIEPDLPSPVRRRVVLVFRCADSPTSMRPTGASSTPGSRASVSPGTRSGDSGSPTSATRTAIRSGCSRRSTSAHDRRRVSGAAAEVVEALGTVGDALEGDRAPVAGRGLGGEADGRLTGTVEREVADEAPPFAVGRRVEANADPILAMRSHTDAPSTTNESQSSDTPRVTTETTMGSRCGEYSKQSFAQTSSRSWSMSTPAS